MASRTEIRCHVFDAKLDLHNVPLKILIIIEFDLNYTIYIHLQDVDLKFSQQVSTCLWHILQIEAAADASMSSNLKLPNSSLTILF